MKTAALLILLLVAAPAAANPKAEAKLKTKVAHVWLDLARWCVTQDLKAEATAAVEAARAMDKAAAGLDAVAGKAEALAGNGQAGDAYAKKHALAGKAAAKHYDKLAKYNEDYAFEALRLDPTKARAGKIMGRIKQLAGNRKSAPEAGRLLVQLRDAYPDGKYDTLETSLARSDVALVKGTSHPLVGYVSLPKSWKKGKTYRVLVAVDGAGSNFLGCARKFAGARGSRPYIVLAPCTLANTNALDPKKYPYYPPALLEDHNGNRITFDVEGLVALLAVLKERYGAEDKIGITGFSGGGNLTYGMLALHPDRVLFAAPACANFSGLGWNDAKRQEGGGPPIRIMTGANDPHREFTHGNKASPGIEPQTDAAMKALERFGYTRVERIMLPGVGHSNCVKKVWDFADEIK